MDVSSSSSIRTEEREEPAARRFEDLTRLL